MRHGTKSFPALDLSISFVKTSQGPLTGGPYRPNQVLDMLGLPTLLHSAALDMLGLASTRLKKKNVF